MRVEEALWPHIPGIEYEPAAQPLLQIISGCLAAYSAQPPRTAADLGRSLGADVRLARLTHPRQGWTWFRPERAVIEVADWLAADMRQLVAAHEVCHLMLGSGVPRHDVLVERVCNWGAAQILDLVSSADGAPDAPLHTPS